MSPERFEAVIVGAGFGGIGAAIELKKLGYKNLLIVDRENDLGGTWHVNHYPGLACDIPSSTYSYWFEPNPDWSRLYAPGGEIKRYAQDVAEKYDVRRYMRFNTAVDSVRWDEDARLWEVALAGGETLTSRLLITATGVLSQPRTPDIPGIDQFAGRIIHTTAWDDDYSFEGRRVGIIGTGATAVQLIPELAKQAAELTVYQRTPIHVVPKTDFPIPKVMRRLFARVPRLQRAFRMLTDGMYEISFVASVLRYHQFWWLNWSAAQSSKMLRFTSVRDKELRRKLTPDYDVGCKRPTFSNSYYRTFAKPHVHLQSTGIERIEPDGVVASDGTTTEIDTLVLATGFDLWESNFPAIEIIGRDGRNLGKWWRNCGFQAYQGVSIPYFPNLLNLASPYAVSLNFFDMMEYQMRHMNRLLGEVRRLNATTFEVTEDANERFCSRLSRLQRNTVFHRGDCANSRSYYFSPDGQTYLRATSTRTTVSEQTSFPLTDYAIS
ncbi:flavin-containing monooxygenase [Mycolicibacterium mengxianglii]|uniref:flavin-containing monooxygenase n=1 Tax=Mycolicibacterium mengxianglii TaxID=2736649 RepID=UPI0018D05B1A|nr:NAD(P)/FAD-dependent oxidoreductase [Mycolicibacterium mengxianglii]